ncbi:MAG: dehydrogenase [Planctomycetia bacterium 21-64-5]|nr:MAG: dehydrogenase [Planctomycetia bacterium 21-64-5]HQU47103.1 Gfo/Idh/MocA family oxidoreductase [Pirellulales bacterium]
MKLRVGLVGLGQSWEVRHRPALRALADRFEVTAVCDQIAVRAEQAARDFGAQAIDGFRALAYRPDVDAILMLAPQWYGYLPILAACDAGKAVYCATTLEIELEEARRVKQRVEQAGVAFMSEFPRRQSPATLRLKELIATRLGPPRLLFCHMRRPAEELPALTPRVRTRISPTGDLMELVDWCCYVVGHKPSSVLGLQHSGPDGTDDYQMMNLDFSGGGPPGTGPTAQISCGRYMPAMWQEATAYRPPAALQVACERGIAFIDLPTTLVWFDEAGRHQEALDSERPLGEQLLSQFHRSVTSLVRNSAGLDDAYRALAIVEQARASHAQWHRIALDF